MRFKSEILNTFETLFFKSMFFGLSNLEIYALMDI